HRDELLVLAEVGEERLDHQELLESRQAALPGEVHLAHAAAGETLEELVAAELCLHGGSVRGAEKYASTRSGGRPNASAYRASGGSIHAWRSRQTSSLRRQRRRNPRPRAGGGPITSRARRRCWRCSRQWRRARMRASSRTPSSRRPKPAISGASTKPSRSRSTSARGSWRWSARSPRDGRILPRRWRSSKHR